jgi:hypothetical protein
MGRDMSTRTKVLAVLSLPVGLAAYLVTGMILAGLSLPDGLSGLLTIFLPLFVAGLCMIPFIAPAFDSMAKRDLAALDEQKRRVANDGRGRDDAASKGRESRERRPGRRRPS